MDSDKNKQIEALTAKVEMLEHRVEHHVGFGGECIYCGLKHEDPGFNDPCVSLLSSTELWELLTREDDAADIIKRTSNRLNEIVNEFLVRFTNSDHADACRELREALNQFNERTKPNLPFKL